MRAAARTAHVCRSVCVLRLWCGEGHSVSEHAAFLLPVMYISDNLVWYLQVERNTETDSWDTSTAVLYRQRTNT